MKLSTKQRVLLLNMSGAFTGNMVALREVRQFRESLSITEEENKTVNLRNTPEGFQWDEPNGPLVVEIDVPDRAKELVAAMLEKMNEADGLTMDHMDLFDLFVPDDSSNGDHPGAEIPSEEVVN